MHFRPAEPGDAESIAALHAQSWQRAYRGMMPDPYLDGPVVAQAIGRRVARQDIPIAEANKALIRRWLSAANAGFTNDFEAYFSKDYSGHLGGRTHMGLAELIRLEREFAFGFSPVVRTIDDLIASGDRVVLRLTSTARHIREWQGIPPTGRRVTYTAMVIYRILDGRIVESWGEVDFASLWQQLRESTR